MLHGVLSHTKTKIWAENKFGRPPALLVSNLLVFVLKKQKVLRISSQTSAPKISAAVDGGLSGGSSVHRPGSDDPHRHQRNLRTLGQPLPAKKESVRVACVCYHAICVGNFPLVSMES